MSVQVQVIFYSMYGHLWKMAEAEAEGARSVEGVEVELYQVAETLSDDVLTKMGALEAKKAFAHIPIADPKKLSEVDGLILGSPTRYGSATAQMQAFIDSTGGIWKSGALIGKVGGLFTSTATQHGGQETTLMSMMTFLLHMGMAVVGVPYSNSELSVIDQMSGGTPYGASTIAGGSGERQPSENELAIARAQGKYVAEMAVRCARK